jgi:hypothetical protein
MSDGNDWRVEGPPAISSRREALRTVFRMAHAITGCFDTEEARMWNDWLDAAEAREFPETPIYTADEIGPEPGAGSPSWHEQRVTERRYPGGQRCRLCRELGHKRTTCPLNTVPR